ncbi:phage terminase large subunit family protein [Acinetobacter higginsii]|uniref:phage terminase large subunit family protein n=1 Tax=Acinetobacter higginsii TaxID=70347 RepID=UPI001F4B22C3|nr:terminase gpA endonuclease subunit [Acinetobacter higginsii]MCH7381383.1 phage terminase large subunit family protein [Acinetobacter higginsii]
MKLKIRASFAEALRPPPFLSVSKWAEQYMVLSSDYSASTGRFKAYPYQNDIMDAMTDTKNKTIVVMKSARVGYTQVLNNAFGYFIHYQPSPILIVQPRNSDAEDHSKGVIAPMLRDVPALAKLGGNVKSRDTNQTILSKKFNNSSSVKLIGADSPGGFRRVTVRVVMFDEIDGYPVGGAGAEGDQISLGKKRAETYWNSVIVLGSTPTNKGDSRIEKAWLNSDMRRYFVPCPHCKELQVLEWGGKETPHGIKWKRDEHGEYIEDSAYYSCINGCEITEDHKGWMIQNGVWQATATFKGHAGFHIWSGYSLLPNAGWSRLVEEWLNVHKDPLQRKTFFNLVLGEPFDDLGESVLPEGQLLDRCESWIDEVPDGVGVLTAGIDFQYDRCEIEVVGWGRFEESWSIAYETIYGEIDDPAYWNKIDAYLKKRFRRGDGRPFTIAAACLDSGGQEGHTQKVYDFCKERLGRKVWAIKGESARNGKRSPVWPTKKPTSRTKKTFKPIILGVNSAKDQIRRRLHLEVAGPGYMHFPSDRDLGYFQQLLAERLMTKKVGADTYRVWELPAGKANEALDCRVYAYSALCGLNHMGLKLNSLCERVEKQDFVPMEEVERVLDDPMDINDIAQSGGETVNSVLAAKVETVKKKTRAELMAEMNN